MIGVPEANPFDVFPYLFYVFQVCPPAITLMEKLAQCTNELRELFRW
jgi:hypothetical protein